MKKSMISMILAASCVFAFAFGSAACNETPDKTGDKWGDVYTIETAYAEARKLGYSGSLEDFIASISGKDGSDGVDGKDGVNGVGIAEIVIKDGNLLATLTDGREINCGKVSGENGVCKHEYSEWEVGKAATCVSIGYNTRACSKCGNVEYDFIEETGHVWDEDCVRIESTDEKIGIQLFICTECGTAKAEKIGAMGHTPGTSVIENRINATCKEEGYYDSVVYCSTCGKELSRETITLPILEQHIPTKEVEENRVESTYTTAGHYDSVVYCSTCAQELSRERIALPLRGPIEGVAPSETRYSLGDRMYDFTVTLSDGATFTLSEVLKGKDLVVLDFWATWCPPCKAQFPALNEAAALYKDSVAVLAVSVDDTAAEVEDFKSEYGYHMDMAPVGNDNLATMFGVTSIPRTVMIDRYGRIVFYHTGAVTSASRFTEQFDKFVGEDYLPAYVTNKQA